MKADFDYKEFYLSDYKERPTCNPKGIMFHCTGGSSGTAAVNWFHSPENKEKTCSNLVIDRNGGITLLLPSTKTAYHAGVGEWGEYKDNINSSFLGFELANASNAIKGDYDHYGYPIGKKEIINNQEFQTYPDKQIRTAAYFAAYYMNMHNIPINMLIGHSDYAPSRKKYDPGPHFPWEKLKEYIEYFKS